MIKALLNKGYRICEISRLLGLKKEKAYYWSKTEIKLSQTKQKKSKNGLGIRSRAKGARGKSPI